MIRPALALVLLAALADPSLAQTTPRAPAATTAPANPAPAAPAAPQRLGAFNAWTAATHQEPAGKVCYAFTRIEGRPSAILTVTHRPQGRDQVALRIGRPFPRNAEVTVDAGTADLNFYTAGDNAFARDGRATVNAFRNAREAVAKSPAANNRPTTETFSLNGFAAAYDAITRECPAGPPRR